MRIGATRSLTADRANHVDSSSQAAVQETTFYALPDTSRFHTGSSQGGKTRHARMFLGVGQIGKLDHDRTVGGGKRIHHLRVRSPGC